MSADETTESAPLHVADVVELVEHAELVDVVTHRHHAERSEGAFADTTHGETEPFAIAIRGSDDTLDVRLDTAVTCTDDVRLEVAVSIVYRFDVRVDYDRSTLSEFIARVAVMAGYPYVREAFMDLAARMRVTPPVLPLLRPGQIGITPVDDPEPSVQPTDTTDS